MAPILLLLHAVALADPSPSCGPTPAAAVRDLCGHRYVQIGRCNGMPVFRTDRTDSTALDRAASPDALVLVTGESVDPRAAAGDWPAPPGNLYLSAPLAGDRVAARARLSSALAAWWVAALPDLALTESWEGDYGAHRAPDGRLLSGLLVADLPSGAAIGLDLHLNATEADYVARGHPGAHVSLATLRGQAVDVDAALWTLLPLLLDPGADPP